MSYGQPQAPMSYADAPAQNDFSDLIPHGTLAFGLLKIRWFNADQGIIVTQSKSSDAQFLDCEVTIVPDPRDGFVGAHKGRKVFTRIGVAGTEGYINMGRSAIKAILETGNNAGPTNPAGYEIAGYEALDGMLVAIKVKEEPAKGDFKAKNDIALWLSPVDSVTAKDWARLLAHDVEPKAKTGAAAKPATPGWQQSGAPASPTAPAAGAAARSLVAAVTAPLAKPAFLIGGPGTGHGSSVAPQPAAPASGPSWAR